MRDVIGAYLGDWFIVVVAALAALLLVLFMWAVAALGAKIPILRSQAALLAIILLAPPLTLTLGLLFRRPFMLGQTTLYNANPFIAIFVLLLGSAEIIAACVFWFTPPDRNLGGAIRVTLLLPLCLLSILLELLALLAAFTLLSGASSF